MIIEVDFNSDEAIYVQLMNQIIMGIATSRLQEGDPLPSVRQLADTVGINMHTVNKAYSLLRQEGFVTIDRRRGAIIAVDVDKIKALEELKENLITKPVDFNNAKARIEHVAYSKNYNVWCLQLMKLRDTNVPAKAKDFEEAAYVDGASYFTTMVKIIFPMAKPSIVTVILFSFLSFWNEYIISMTLLTKPELKTLPVGLMNLMAAQKSAVQYGQMYAGLVIVMLPTLILYICVQKKLTQGMTLGGLKE